MAIVRTGVSSTMTSGTAAITVPLPTGCAAGDLAILSIETANQGLGTNPGALGWTTLTGSTATATGTAAAAGGTRLAVLWKFLDASDISTGSVSVSDSGDHQCAAIATYSGVDTTTPITWNSGSGDVGTPATTSVSLASVTRGSASSVCIGIIATDRDSATVSTNTSPSWTGAGAPASNSFIFNDSSASGAGGGLIFNEGTGGSAGAAAFSCSITSSIWVGRVIVLNPLSAVSHDASGALTGQIGSVAGSAAHVAVHTSTGSLTGQLGNVSGSAARTRAHASTGALTGQLGSVTGSATRFRAHASTGALTGQLGSLSGSAARFRAFASSGDLVGQLGSISGAADHPAGTVTHNATGAIIGAGSLISAYSERHGIAEILIGRRRRRGGFSDYGVWRG